MATIFEIPEVDSSRYEIAASVAVSRVSTAVVDPDRDRSNQVVAALSGPTTGAIRLVPGYLPTLQDAPWLASQRCDMILVGLDSDPRDALRTVENLCALSQATVVVYSKRRDQDLMIHAMRSGAREFLTFPFLPGELDEAIARAAMRIHAAHVPDNKKAGELLVFAGAKGGAGVTTVACNYAVDLAQDTSKQTLLIDLNMPLGDAALNLGLSSQHSAVDALRDAVRLDSALLSRLLVRHSSGLSLLAAPGRFPYVPVDNDAVKTLLDVACDSFDYVVVDAGSRQDWTRTHLLNMASRIYLVTQVGIPELRNANRVITGPIQNYAPKLEIVLNRYTKKVLGIDDAVIQRALTLTPQWRIPNDYFAVREMQNRAEPLALNDSPIACVIRRMAAEISIVPLEGRRKGLLGLFS